MLRRIAGNALGTARTVSTFATVLGSRAVRTTDQLLQASPAGPLYRQARRQLLQTVQELLATTSPGDAPTDVPAPAEPSPPEPPAAPRARRDSEPLDAEAVRARFDRLLERSADPVGDANEVLPALADIIDHLDPDEARIVRLFADTGAHPVVRLVLGPLIGTGGRTVAEHLSMIGQRAGCRDTDRTPVYLDDLRRLGVLRIHPEELDDGETYELIEASPEAAAIRTEHEGRANQRLRVVRETARLTALGEQLVEVCFP